MSKNHYFGIALKAILKDREITQQELADAANITVTQLNRLVNGHHNPNFSLVERIAELLNVSVGTFSIQNKENIPDEYHQEIKNFILNPHNIQWIELAKRMRDEGMSVVQAETTLFWSRKITRAKKQKY